MGSSARRKRQAAPHQSPPLHPLRAPGKAAGDTAIPLTEGRGVLLLLGIHRSFGLFGPSFAKWDQCMDLLSYITL